MYLVFQVCSDASFDCLLPVVPSQVTSSLSLPHTACSRSLKASPSLARSYTMAALQEWRTPSSLTVSTLLRCVDTAAREQLHVSRMQMIPDVGCISQANEAVKVDGEVASILTHSRFSEDFTFQPPGEPRESCGVKPKVSGCFSL